MSRKRGAFLGSLLVLAAVASAAILDFESFSTGEIVDDYAGVKVFGFNPAFGSGTNAAVIFDSSNPTGGDYDLKTPGSGANNDTALGNILIIAENLDDNNNDGLVDVPDDADEKGSYFEFDFSDLGGKKGKGTVTVNEVTLMDIEREEGEDGTFILLYRSGHPVSLIAIPPTGDNGVVTIDGINLSGVHKMVIQMNGSGAVDEIVYNEDREGHCWFTFGGFENAGIQSGGKDFTFGGNVGPPPSGAIEVVNHNNGDNFHSNDVEIVECTTINKTGPGQPGGKKGLVTNKATFEGIGRLNGVGGYPFTGYVVDAGEPSGKNSNDKDEFHIVVKHPTSNEIVFEAHGELDGGNVQIHPGK